ncbi:MAG: glutamate 5-kinase [Candidatus Omnitrophica bacterium]|nr:glutamate 5-kinase [Candidatus Omnitrophota bacterium]
MERKFSGKIRRIVVKVGSSVIANERMKPRLDLLKSLTAQIALLRAFGCEVILVSSGAIVFGMGDMGLKKRPADLASLQALAAVGQTVLMKKYKELFKIKKLNCAQILLTWDDFDDRTRFNNARNTFETMLKWGIVPIINENDTIATDEIRFGDNDKLSALVSSLIGADLLVNLSDVDGFYDTRKQNKVVINEIKDITKDIEDLASGTTKSDISRGGMKAKLNAVKIATHAKIPCVIASAHAENVLLRIVKGENIGTLFAAKEEKLLGRKHWISFGAKPKGIIFIDDGAKKAVLQGGRSLLLPGIISSEGNFKKGDVVVVADKDKNEIARGIIDYSSEDLNKGDDKRGKPEAVHRNNLVLTNS